MPIIKVKEGQTLLDIAVQYLGDASKAFEIAITNGLNFSDDLVIGTELIVGDVAVDKKKVVKIFSENNLIPASGKTLSQQQEGIGYWAVGGDFIVQ